MAKQEASRMAKRAAYELIAEEPLGEWAEVFVERSGGQYWVHRRVRVAGARCVRARVYRAEARQVEAGALTLDELYERAVERGWGIRQYVMA